MKQIVLIPELRNSRTGAAEIEAQRQQWKMIKQAGKGFAKMVRRVRIVDPSKIILVYKNGLYEKADQTMIKMLQLYEQTGYSDRKRTRREQVTGTGAGISGSRKNFCQCKMVHATGI